MQIHHRDFINNSLEYNLKPSDGIDLAHGPVIVVCPGVFQADDVMNEPSQKVIDRFRSDVEPYTRQFADSLFKTEDSFLRMFMGGDNDPHRALRGYCEYMDGIFAKPHMKKPEMPQMYVISYRSMEERMKILYDLDKKDQNKCVSDEANEFVWKAILPYLGTPVRDADGTMKVTHRKTVDSIVQSLENLILFGNSTGSGFIVEIENSLQTTLRKSGFPPEARKEIMGAVKSVAIGQLTKYEKLKGSRFTSIYFEGDQDQVAKELNPSEKLRVTPDMLKEFGLSGKTPQGKKQLLMPRLQEQNNRMLVLCSPKTNEFLPIDNPLYSPATIDRQARMVKFVKEEPTGHFHHVAFLALQGYPQKMLPALTKRVMLNMATHPSLSAEKKNNIKITDFISKDWSEYYHGASSNSVTAEKMLLREVQTAVDKAQEEAMGKV